MTLEEYEIYNMFPHTFQKEEKKLYVGSGEDACLETFETSKTAERVQYEICEY